MKPAAPCLYQAQLRLIIRRGIFKLPFRECLQPGCQLSDKGPPLLLGHRAFALHPEEERALPLMKSFQKLQKVGSGKLLRRRLRLHLLRIQAEKQIPEGADRKQGFRAASQNLHPGL